MKERRAGREVLWGVLVTLAVMASGVAAATETTDWPTLIAAAKPAVVWILAETSEGTASGSGAIVSPDGYILTAAHVIEGASQITVVVAESRKFGASVVSSHAAMDVAVLKIPASGLTWLALGDSDQVIIEDEIRVLGYPLPNAGVGFIAVAGIIQGTRDRDGVTLLQHNATTAAGHSGGPVINAQGRMIAVHVAQLVDQPEYHLAISVNDAKTLLPWGALPSGYSPVVLIPAGSFRMGDSFGEGDANEVPVHTVYVSAFYMDKYEVTKALWDEVASWAGAHGYDVGPADGNGVAAGHPVFNISWDEAVKWANARSEKEGLTPCYTVGASVYRTGVSSPNCNWSVNGYRLPTEAEWEKAARGGAEGHRFPWSGVDTIQHSRANYRSSSDYSYDTSPTRNYHPTFATGSSPYTSPVGTFAPNGYGLYDMVGNVWEWCWDWYGESTYASSPGSDARGPASGSYRVRRGGGWGSSALNCRVTNRSIYWPDLGYYFLGFRLVRTAP